MAAQEDAQRDAEEAIAEGDERPAGQGFTKRAIDDATYDAGSKGTLSDEFAEKEGKFQKVPCEICTSMTLILVPYRRLHHSPA